MILIDDKIISDDLYKEYFACNLSACNGACCWEGDMGAPLDQQELAILDSIYPLVKPFLTDKARTAIEEQGNYTYLESEEMFVTTLVDNGPCAYMTYNELGIALCGIEQAWKAGKIDFQKPISCHLYPVRVKRYEDFEALNYDQWDICSPACERGKRQGIKIYEFVKDALIRKYGQSFYEQLEATVLYQDSSGME